MRVNLRSYGSEQELYVDGLLVLAAAKDMGVREALEAISESSEGVDFLAVDLSPGGTLKLFDDRFFTKDFITRSTGGLADQGKRTA